jgi:hypothetical protein
MMMNIRGLVMDDPEHTVYLQTIKFGLGNGSINDLLQDTEAHCEATSDGMIYSPTNEVV